MLKFPNCCEYCVECNLKQFKIAELVLVQLIDSLFLKASQNTSAGECLGIHHMHKLRLTLNPGLERALSQAKRGQIGRHFVFMLWCSISREHFVPLTNLIQDRGDVFSFSFSSVDKYFMTVVDCLGLVNGEVGGPARQGVGDSWSLRSLPTQAILWFCDGRVCQPPALCRLAYDHGLGLTIQVGFFSCIFPNKI